MMKCFRCKGEMHRAVTTFTAEPDDCCIVVRHVPCMICDTCGETAFEPDVSRNLNKIVAQARQALTEVAVVRYSDSVA